jgi:TolB protein
MKTAVCTFSLFLSVVLGSGASDPAARSQESLEPSEEIRVYLGTTSRLSPLYLGKMQSEGPALPASYLSELEGILLFDLNHNGSTLVTPPNEEKERQLQHKDLGKALTASTWREHGAAFVVRPVISAKTLTITLLSTSSGSVKQLAGIPLSGTAAKDRKQIHKVADAIHQALFGELGVASTRILYSVKSKKSSNTGGGNYLSEIWSCDWDGANPHQLTKEGSYGITPVLVPPSATYPNDRFLYVSYKMGGQPKIFIASLTEGIGKRLIDLKGNQLLPAISPQRDRVAFICDAGGRTDLFLQEFHPDRGDVGKPFQLFSFPQSTQASPTFSPDGTKIAFVSDKDGAPRIYVIPASFQSRRAQPALLTKQNHENSCPSWSPDGKKLAYSAKTRGVRQIWIYDFETKEERQLTDGAGNKENPSWAPNSTHLIFNSTDGSSSELFIVNLHQPEAVKISQGPGVKHYPSWGRR